MRANSNRLFLAGQFVGMVCCALFGLMSNGAAQTRPLAVAATNVASLKLERVLNAKQRNVIFILADDHRFDALGFLNHPFLQTPNLDMLARNGVHLKNAFVTTALCSPSRASILTGLYAHKHRVVDNNNPVRTDLIFFPQYLQQAGYETAFFGKWHMGGDSDERQRGFDHWVSFKGQGSYLPGKNVINVNGKRVAQKGYITDELTDYTIDWLTTRNTTKPFMLYLSHKAVHAEFIPADRHKGRYANKPYAPPRTQANTPENYEGKPMWVKNQRNSWHGVDYPYHGTLDSVEQFYKRYCETLLAVDESLGRVIDYLKETNLLESTLLVYMGDNGFMFGEHGLIDKRVAYEESMRVPMLVHCPELITGGVEISQMVANIDIAPTVLEAVGLKPPTHMDGRSFLSVAQGRATPWRDALLYEYYWERNFPQTPTMHAVRGDRYKYIRYQGLWDIDEFYDLQVDPQETRNLIRSTQHQQLIKQFNTILFNGLSATDGMVIPLLPDVGGQNNLRSPTGSPPAPFPPYFLGR